MNAHDAKRELHLIKGPYRERLSQHPAELMANRRVLALDTAIAAIDQLRWRPIEEAPEDTPVILASPQTWPEPCWEVSVGVGSVTNFEGGQTRHGYATHWMPLPEPPEAA